MDHRKQIDVVFLDFSNTFDSLSHQRLLNKLDTMELIITYIYQWIKAWLTQRSQCAVLDGVSSDFVSVQSGVPQWTVLGPLMFLLCINDISMNIHSPLRLFVDDHLLYRVITSVEDATELHCDLDQLFQWSKLWQLKFNVSKCVVVHFTRSLSPITYHY